jgi:uncharacterized protein YjbI with pentapeptide repeats
MANEDRRGADRVGMNLQGAALTEADRQRRDLTQADLQRVAFAQADLTGADLLEAHLQKSDLSEANLAGADFQRADLSQANLTDTHLLGTHLSGSCLDGASLIGATCSSADLTGASFRGARLAWTNFVDVDLSQVRGLNAVEHTGPSSIGITTLYRSRGNISEDFLQRAGVPEDFILYVRSLVRRASEFYACFISYNHPDKAFARWPTVSGRAWYPAGKGQK